MLEQTARPRAKAFRMTQWEANEFAIHISVVDAVRKFAWPDCLFFHVPNGEVRDPRTGAKLKAMGTRRGVADLVFIRPGAPPLFLELKDRVGRQSATQIEFQTAAERAGAQYVVAHSLDGALEVLWQRGFLARKLV
jgi:hypothetical protein